MACCSKGVVVIVFGTAVTFIGFVMTMYGNLHKPFWDETSDWCDFCRESRQETLKNTRNCKIVGPIFLVIGVLMIISGAIMKKKDAASQPPQTGVTITTHLTSPYAPGAVQTGHYPANGNPPETYPPQGSYPPDGKSVGTYPQSMPPYPPPQASYPQQPGNSTQPVYPPPQGYAPSTGYPTNPGYPQDAYPLSSYPQPATYPQQDGGSHIPPPPSYESIATPSAPPR